METGQVRFVYRHVAFLGPESVRAAEASECAGEQGRFWEYHDTLFDNWEGENVGAFSDTKLVRFARFSGVDTQSFISCLESERYRRRVQDDTRAARELGVRSTPTIFVNGRRVDGLQDYSTYRQIIDEELAKAQ